MKREQLIYALCAGVDDKTVHLSKNDVPMICHVPQVAPFAYLHVLHAGIDIQAIYAYEREEGVRFPSEVVGYLQEFNGLSLFSGALHLNGLRRGMIKREIGVRLPFDMRDDNQVGSVRDAHDHDFVIGGYKYDGSLLFLEGDNQQVLRRRADKRVVLNRWSDVSSMLEMEVERLSRLFGRDGYALDPDVPTTPVVAEAVLTINQSR